MNGPLPAEIGTALLIAFGFAAIGSLILTPKMRSLLAWNDSFLVGAGVSAAVLLPLSLVFPRSALRITWGAVLLGALLLIVATLRRWISGKRVPRGEESTKRRFGKIGAGGWAVLALTVVATSCFAVMNARWSYNADGLLIWATKAQVLFTQGALAPEPKLWLNAGYLGRNATYPPLVPLMEALMSMTHRRFSFDVSKTIFLLFYISLLLSTYRTARALTNVRLGLLATALVSWLPSVSAGETVSGYADLPFACFLAAVAANLVDGAADAGWRSPAPWLIGSLLMVKSEGIILLPIIGIVVFLTWLGRPLVGVGKKLVRNWRSLAVIGSILLMRVGYLKWLGYNDTDFRPVTWANILRARTLVTQVANLCGSHLLSLKQYALFWPAFALFGTILLVKGSAKEKGLMIGATLGLAAYSSIFLFTAWDITVLVATAYDRLLLQLTPIAAVCIVTGYHAVRSGRGPSLGSPGKERGGVQNSLR